MSKMLQVIGGLAAAGVVAAGSTALTGTGLGVTGLAASPQVVGGQITQSVSGAVLSNIQYGFADAPAKTQVNLVTLTFTGGNGRTVALSPTGGTFGGGSPTADEFHCPDAVVNLSTVCQVAANNSGAHTVNGGYYTGLTQMTVTVS
ncbi:hypothetical protein [Actinoplanes sp. M2I2]|uniref:hypothetical protein n=1 Tax=Actinoplanes sp. M2I2 TaxID=1734444 RepID=UPI0020209382|nr:hypothetical protein [Actinoplanes sp. M2I2]